MSSYWWECDRCEKQRSFKDVCGVGGVAHFIRDVLIPSDWDQSALVRPCECAKGELGISYEFPKAEREHLRVIHMVGLAKPSEPNKIYVPMMWESRASSDPENWFDFKYINERSVWGLNKPAVFNRSELRELFRVYEEQTHSAHFP